VSVVPLLRGNTGAAGADAQWWSGSQTQFDALTPDATQVYLIT